MSEDIHGPLDGLRILDLTRGIAGPYATKLFVDAGADVSKVEPESGDPMRREAAAPGSSDEEVPGLLFAYLNAGKRSLVLEPRDARDRARLRALAEQSDLVFEDWGPGVLEEHGLDPEDWIEAHPRLSVVRLSPWGQDGPWARRPANDFTLQAATGAVEERALPGGRPVAAGGRLGEWAAGAFAAVSGLAAWRSARQTGEGQIADLSVFEAMLQTFTPFADLGAQLRAALPARRIDVPFVEPTRDGALGFAPLDESEWKRLCAAIGRPELGREPGLARPEGRVADHERVRDALQDALQAKTTREWQNILLPLGLPVTPVADASALPEMEPLRSRGSFVRSPLGFLQPRAPWRLESSPPAPVRSAPELDANREELLARIQREPNSSAHRLGHADLPFAGLRVLDISGFHAGPYAASILSDLGADVIKLESLRRPDEARFIGQGEEDRPWERAPLFHGANPGKRALALRLEDDRGRELAQRLVGEADVVIDDAPQLEDEASGFDPERLRALNSRLIQLRMPAFGAAGPAPDRRHAALAIEQFCGLATTSGEAALPIGVGGASQTVWSAHAVFALGLALDERARTGLGQIVEVTGVESALAIAAPPVMSASAFGSAPEPMGNRMPHAAPQGIFETARERERLAVSVTTEEQWRGLCAALGAEDWRRDESLSTHSGRFAAHDALCARLSAWARTRLRDDCLATLHAEGVPASASLHAPEIVPHAQLAARRFFQDLTHPVTGRARFPSFPAAFSLFERELHRSAPPTLGQHDREILQGELGVREDAFDRLEQARVIGDRPDER